MFYARENNNKLVGEGEKSLKRAVSVIHMASDIGESTWDHREIVRYGLGKGMLIL
jgi:hypothetical protein